MYDKFRLGNINVKMSLSPKCSINSMPPQSNLSMLFVRNWQNESKKLYGRAKDLE